MRLHRLAVRAWGPFADAHEVDFDRLGEGGLFLVHGATGSGKTSVLDAVCFALYADVPGERSRASLRSDHAGAGAVPGVELEFTASGRRFSVERSPEFHRLRRRGQGTTRVQPRVVLREQVAGRWVERGTRLDEVGLLLQDVLGMDLNQFATVVLLPQGRFAAFLSAAPEQRRSVLERLFDTRRFTRVEDWLADRRREVVGRLSVSQDALRVAQVRINDVLVGIEGKDMDADMDATGGSVRPTWDELELGDFPAAVRDIADRLCEQATGALARRELAARDAATTETALYAGQSAQRDRTVAAQARADLAAVDAADPEVAQARLRLMAAERASAVTGHVDAADHVRRRLHAATEAAVRARAGLGDRALQAPDLVDGADLLARAAHAAAQAGAESSRASEHAAEHELARRSLERLDGEGRADAQAREVLAARLEDLRAEAALLPDLARRRRALERAVVLLAELAKQAAALPAARDRARCDRDTWLGERERALDLQERRLAGMAGELAADLVAGVPCGVCGSPDHPQPAAQAAGAVSAGQVTAARTRAEEAAARLQLAERELATIGATLAAGAAEVRALDVPGLSDAPVLGDQVGDASPGDRPAVSGEDAQALLADAVRQRTVAERAAADAERAGAHAEEVQRELTELVGRRERGQVEVAEWTGTLQRHGALADETQRRAAAAGSLARALLDEHARRCPCVRDSQPDVGPRSLTSRDAATALVGQARTRHERVQQAADAWTEARQHEQSAAGELAAAARREQEALAAAGFASTDEARAAVLTPAEVLATRRRLEELDARRAGAEAILAQPAVQAAEQAPEPDLAALQEAHRAAAAVLAGAGRRHDRLEHALRALRPLQLDVASAVAELGPAQQERELLQALAECVGGTSPDNTLRMRLSSYVLAARLEEVVELANERLTRLSDGRFTLQHSDELAGRGARSGLGLRVLDAWTGVSRPTGSLSGGEAFMASLALALGLGDAVRAEAGGFDLQTLFIDEGFGTLDEESLEQVLGVLDGLRDGGRTVGIVSHVPELRLRIPYQLHVHKTSGGSTLQVRTHQVGESVA